MREPLIYEQRQFRSVLYTLLLLGFTGYAIAAETPGLWLISVGATLLNMWLVYHDSFRPLPRVVANVVTLLFAGWMVLEVRMVPSRSAIFAIGEFLTFLQLVKLFEQRGNRDFAQLLVLSLLLSVAAAISTASLVFGVLFVCYLFLSLYACLLFHLKAESDHARAVMRNRERPLGMTALRQNQRFISRSMRRLTAAISVLSIGMAIFVFVFFPRGTGAGLIGNLAFKPADTMTGFSDQVDFQQVSQITQNDNKVAYVTVTKTKDGKIWGGTDTALLLRGNALDAYNTDPIKHWTWARTRSVAKPIRANVPMTGGMDTPLHETPPNRDLYQQDIRLLPTGSPTLFAMPGVISFRPSNDKRLDFGSADDVMQLRDELRSELSYRVTSTNAPIDTYVAQPSTPPIDAPRIRAFALRDEVAGVNAGGNLARQRLERRGERALDEQIARNFENYLQQNYSYTLDLTDVRLIKDNDPLEQFLYSFKRGHCEYFAGAMARMCQSIGMDARVVVGFKCYDFNSVGGYYLVKQSDAHAWVEVLTAKGWQTFDPTAGGSSLVAHKLSMWKQAASLFNFLEYKWGNAVVNYDTDSRNNLIQQVDSSLTETKAHTSDWMERVRKWFDANNFVSVYNALMTAAFAAMAVGCVAAVGYFIYERIRLRRRARRIGLNALPVGDRRRLARQLLFYDELLRSFDRRSIPRQAHLTPGEFSKSVNFLPAEVYDAVQRLTRVFYRVRYGGVELQPAQQRRLLRVVENIDHALNPGA